MLPFCREYNFLQENIKIFTFFNLKCLLIHKKPAKPDNQKFENRIWGNFWVMKTDTPIFFFRKVFCLYKLYL